MNSSKVRIIKSVKQVFLENSSGVAILVSLQECGFFQHITVHRTTTSRKPQVKIRLAFHFVERNYLLLD